MENSNILIKNNKILCIVIIFIIITIFICHCVYENYKNLKKKNDYKNLKKKNDYKNLISDNNNCGCGI